METKVLRKYFGLADFIDEQRFLEQQHREGMKFVKFEPFIKYTFEKCIPEEYVYQLDYKEDKKDDATYIQMFVDCGWEYIMKYGTWYYFRKPKSDILKQDNEIFSDKDSKINMIKKVMWFTLLITAVCLIPSMTVLMNTMSIESNDKDIVYTCIMIFYSLFMLFLLSLNVRNVVKLNKLIHEIENPLNEKDK